MSPQSLYLLKVDAFACGDDDNAVVIADFDFFGTACSEVRGRNLRLPLAGDVGDGDARTTMTYGGGDAYDVFLYDDY